MRADRLKNVRPIVINNSSVASGKGQAASSRNFSVAATEKLPVCALSYKAESVRTPLRDTPHTNEEFYKFSIILFPKCDKNSTVTYLTG